MATSTPVKKGLPAETVVKEGYKQTELGVIPEDWGDRVFKSLYSESSRNGIYKTAEFQGRGTRIVNMGEMFGFEFISDQEMSRVELTKKELVLSGLQDGDLLFGRRSVVPAGAGKCSIVVSLQEPLTFESSIIRVRLNSEEANPLYYYYFFASQTGRTLISTIVSGTNIKGIRASELKELIIPLPTKTEQSAIATVLSDTDALIESLDKLIAKKKAIKQGAMQQLLTGKKRLPGFSGEWEVKKLGDFLDYEQPTAYLVTDTEYNDNNSTPVLTAGKSFFLGYTNEEHGIFNKLPVIIFDDFTTAVQFVDFPFKAKSSAMKMLLPKNEKINLRFIYEIMLQIKFPLGDHKRHWIGEYQHLEISVPATYKEQIAIATVLSDMDSEIEKLEQKRDKYAMLKQGMMQVLLTGKIRLV